MRNIFSILIIASLFFNTACTRDENVYNAEELSSGSSFGNFTIKSISPDEGEFNMVLEGKTIIKDTLDRAPIDYLGIKNNLLSEKIKTGDEILDLGNFDVIYFQNSELVALYLDESMIEETPDGKTTFSGGAPIEVVLTDIHIDLNSRDIITAKVSNVLAINGQQNPEIKEPMLVKLKHFFENQLRVRVSTLAGQEPFNDGLFVTNDITDFSMYRKNEPFRDFVDDLLSYGYGIEQAEGDYHLYVGEPTNYRDGEEDALPPTMTVDELKEMDSFNGLPIEEFRYLPKDLLVVKLSGQFEISGDLYYDEMWRKVFFMADVGIPYTTELEVDGFTFETMSYIQLTNEEKLKSALEDGQMGKLKSGEMISATMSAKNFSMEVAYNEGAFQKAEFIEFVDEEAHSVAEAMTVEDLKKVHNFGELVIDKLKYTPRDVLDVKFTGEFEVSGQLYYDEMWSEVGFTADEESPYTTELEVDGFTFKTMNYMKFSNEEYLKSALEDGQLEKLKSGEMIPVAMSAEDFSIEVAYEKGAFQKTNFIEFAD